MAEHSGMYYASFWELVSLRLSMLVPCFKYDGGCIYNDPSNPKFSACKGADITCEYYSFRFKYLTPGSTGWSDYIVTQQLLEIVGLYSSMYDSSNYNPLTPLLNEGLFGSDGETGYTEDGCNIVLPQRARLDDMLEIITEPVSPDSTSYSDYLSFINSKVFSLFIPFAVYPQSDIKAVGLDGVYTLICTDSSVFYVKVYYLYLSQSYSVKVNNDYFSYIKSLDKEALARFNKSVKSFLKTLYNYNCTPFSVFNKIGSNLFGGVIVSKGNNDIYLLEVNGSRGIEYHVVSLDVTTISVDIHLKKYNLGANSVFDLGVYNSLDVFETKHRDTVYNNSPSEDDIYDPTKVFIQPEPTVKGLDMVCSLDIYSNKKVATVIKSDGLFQTEGNLDRKSYNTSPLSLFYMCADSYTLSGSIKYGTTNKITSDYITLYVKVVGSNIIVRVDQDVVLFVVKKATISTSANDVMFKMCVYSNTFYGTEIADVIKTKSGNDDIKWEPISSNTCILCFDSDVPYEDKTGIGSTDIDNMYISLDIDVVADIKTTDYTSSAVCDDGTTLYYPDDLDNILVDDTFCDCVTEDTITYNGKDIGKIVVCDNEGIDYTGVAGKGIPYLYYVFFSTPTSNTITKVIEDYISNNDAGESLFSGKYPTVSPYLFGMGSAPEYLDPGIDFIDGINSVSYLYSEGLYRSFFSTNMFFSYNFFSQLVGDQPYGAYPVFCVTDTSYFYVANYPLYKSHTIRLFPHEEIVSNIVEVYKYTVERLYLNSEGFTNISDDILEFDISDLNDDQLNWLEDVFRYIDPFYVRSYSTFELGFFVPHFTQYRDDMLRLLLDIYYKCNKADDPNLNHLSGIKTCFGLPTYGFSKKYKEDTNYTYLDNPLLLDIDTGNKAYFIIRGITKFTQNYLVSLSVGNDTVSFVVTLPMFISQRGAPDIDVVYKWTSVYDIYTYLYNGTGLNPFDTKNIEGIVFFSNPIFYVVYSNYRFMDTSAVAGRDYGLLFNVWWPFDISVADLWDRPYIRDVFMESMSCERAGNSKCPRDLDMYTVLHFFSSADDYDSIEDPTQCIATFKQHIIFELDTIPYTYTPYCGDHSFYIDNPTPGTLGRGSDIPVSKEGKEVNLYGGGSTTYYTMAYGDVVHEAVDAITTPRTINRNRLVGYMWFPFRSCEVARYNETADRAGGKILDNTDDMLLYLSSGFECYDLIFKPYVGKAGFSDAFLDAFLDDVAGCFNPYRYVTHHFSVSHELSDISDCSIVFDKSYTYNNILRDSIDDRGIAVVIKGDVSDIVVNEYGYVVDDIGYIEHSNYIVIDMPVSDSTEYIDDLYNFTLNVETGKKNGVQNKSYVKDILGWGSIPPYNCSNNKFIVGFEKFRKGDANFIYQAFYPFHKRGEIGFVSYLAEYNKGKGVDVYGDDYSKYLLPMCEPILPPPNACIYNSFYGRESFYESWGLGTDITFGEIEYAYGFHADFLSLFSNLFNPKGGDFKYDPFTVSLLHNGGEIKSVDAKEALDYVKTNLSRYGSDYVAYHFGGAITKPNAGSIISDVFLYYGPHEECNNERADMDVTLFGASLVEDGEEAHKGVVYSLFDLEDIYSTYTNFVYKTTKSDSYVVEEDYKKVERLPVFGCMGKVFNMFYFSYIFGSIENNVSDSGNLGWYTRDDYGNIDKPFICSAFVPEGDACFADKAYDYAWLPPIDKYIKCGKLYYNMYRDLDLTIKRDAYDITTYFLDYVKFTDVLVKSNDVWVYKVTDVAGGLKEVPVMIFYDSTITSYSKMVMLYNNSSIVVTLPDIVEGDYKIIDPILFGSSVNIKYSISYKNNILNILTIIVVIDGNSMLLDVTISNKGVINISYSNVTVVNSVFIYKYGITDTAVSFNTDVYDENEHGCVSINGTYVKVERGFTLNFNSLLSTDEGSYPFSYKPSVLTVYSDISDYKCIDSDTLLFSSVKPSFVIGFKTDFFIDVSSIEDMSGYIPLGKLYGKSQGAVDSGFVSRSFDYSYQVDDTDDYEYYIEIGTVFGKVSNNPEEDRSTMYRCTPSIRFNTYYNTVIFGITDYMFLPYITPLLFKDKIELEVGTYNGGDLVSFYFTENSSLKAFMLKAKGCDVNTIDIYDNSVGDAIINNSGVINFAGGSIITTDEHLLEDVTYVDDGVIDIDTIRNIFGYIDSSIDNTTLLLKSYVDAIDSHFKLYSDIVDIEYNLCSAYGLFIQPEWYAPGHRLDVYSDANIPHYCGTPIATLRAFMLSNEEVPSVFVGNNDLFIDTLFKFQETGKKEAWDNNSYTCPVTGVKCVHTCAAANEYYSSCVFGEWVIDTLECISVGSCDGANMCDNDRYKSYVFDCDESYVDKYVNGNWHVLYSYNDTVYFKFKDHIRSNIYSGLSVIPLITYYITHVDHGVYGFPGIDPVSDNLVIGR